MLLEAFKERTTIVFFMSEAIKFCELIKTIVFER